MQLRRNMMSSAKHKTKVFIRSSVSFFSFAQVKIRTDIVHIYSKGTCLQQANRKTRTMYRRKLENATLKDQWTNISYASKDAMNVSISVIKTSSATRIIQSLWTNNPLTKMKKKAEKYQI